jgi:hypothetical protein
LLPVIFILLPALTEVGDYTFASDRLLRTYTGSPSQVYTGAFTVVLPVIEGAITDAAPARAWRLVSRAAFSRPRLRTATAVTPGFVPGLSFSVASQGGTDVRAGLDELCERDLPLTNQNYLRWTIAPPITVATQGDNLVWMARLFRHGINSCIRNLVNGCPTAVLSTETTPSFKFPFPWVASRCSSSACRRTTESGHPRESERIAAAN